MATDAKNIWLMILSGIIIALLACLATLGIQKLLSTPTSTTNNTIPTAQVINVQPHYVTKLVPYQSCRQITSTTYTQPNQPTGAGTLIGGLAGGALGTQLGHGNGRTAATIGGAVLGALAGNQIEANMDQPQAQTNYSTSCKTKYASRKTQQGYEVTYLYNGQQGMSVMPLAPTSNTIPAPMISSGSTQSQ